MKDPQSIQEASEALNREVQRQEDKMEKEENSQISGVNISMMGPMASKSTVISFSQEDNMDSLKEINSFLFPKKKGLSNFESQSSVIGEGEDYFLSLFRDSNKFLDNSHHTRDIFKRFSMILEEVGTSMCSSLGDIEIAEVNAQGLFVRLLNSSPDKELEIGDHILQQNVKGQAVSLYQFLPNIVMQANSTVTVWAAASEAKHHPPSDFVWKEQNKFKTSPDCTTILCKPNGEAIAWYTPIHWKQAWEKLETDIEFDRCSVVTPTFRKHVFQWTTPAAAVTKENQDQSKGDTSTCLVEQSPPFIKREKEIPPSLFPNRSPWGHSPSVPAHPYCPLIDPYNICTTGSNLERQPRCQSTRPDPAPGTKKKRKSKLQKQ
ncbi:lamin tail domain-containing protein 1 isoform X2 [Marmota marmota marmota]|uniref:lamin tail domain-containing protein 1 isoform X2 n=1 Tax=Marmota marmota marmota TaxID=9994 RepID=UPI0020937FBC|nr:lamin tail domain-containing protein 1 isoform X2 [Marmota marmota marmota]